MNTVISTADAIKVSKELLFGGFTPDFLLIALIADGFESKKAETILSWAQKQILKDLENIPDLIA